jgi:hypothetical protein
MGSVPVFPNAEERSVYYDKRRLLLQLIHIGLAIYACVMLTVIAVLIHAGSCRIPQEPFAIQGWEGTSIAPRIKLSQHVTAPEPVLVRSEDR